MVAPEEKSPPQEVVLLITQQMAIIRGRAFSPITGRGLFNQKVVSGALHLHIPKHLPVVRDLDPMIPRDCKL